MASSSKVKAQDFEDIAVPLQENRASSFMNDENVRKSYDSRSRSFITAKDLGGDAAPWKVRTSRTLSSIGGSIMCLAEAIDDDDLLLSNAHLPQTSYECLLMANLDVLREGGGEEPHRTPSPPSSPAGYPTATSLATLHSVRKRLSLTEDFHRSTVATLLATLDRHQGRVPVESLIFRLYLIDTNVLQGVNAPPAGDASAPALRYSAEHRHLSIFASGMQFAIRRLHNHTRGFPEALFTRLSAQLAHDVKHMRSRLLVFARTPTPEHAESVRTLIAGMVVRYTQYPFVQVPGDGPSIASAAVSRSGSPHGSPHADSLAGGRRPPTGDGSPRGGVLGTPHTVPSSHRSASPVWGQAEQRATSSPGGEVLGSPPKAALEGVKASPRMSPRMSPRGQALGDASRKGSPRGEDLKLDTEFTVAMVDKGCPLSPTDDVVITEEESTDDVHDGLAVLTVSGEREFEAVKALPQHPGSPEEETPFRNGVPLARTRPQTSTTTLPPCTPHPLPTPAHPADTPLLSYVYPLNMMVYSTIFHTFFVETAEDAEEVLSASNRSSGVKGPARVYRTRQQDIRMKALVDMLAPFRKMFVLSEYLHASSFVHVVFTETVDGTLSIAEMFRWLSVDCYYYPGLDLYCKVDDASLNHDERACRRKVLENIRECFQTKLADYHAELSSAPEEMDMLFVAKLYTSILEFTALSQRSGAPPPPSSTHTSPQKAQSSGHQASHGTLDSSGSTGDPNVTKERVLKMSGGQGSSGEQGAAASAPAAAPSGASAAGKPAAAAAAVDAEEEEERREKELAKRFDALCPQQMPVLKELFGDEIFALMRDAMVNGGLEEHAATALSGSTYCELVCLILCSSTKHYIRIKHKVVASRCGESDINAATQFEGWVEQLHRVARTDGGGGGGGLPRPSSVYSYNKPSTAASTGSHMTGKPGLFAKRQPVALATFFEADSDATRTGAARLAPNHAAAQPFDHVLSLHQINASLRLTMDQARHLLEVLLLEVHADTKYYTSSLLGIVPSAVSIMMSVYISLLAEDVTYALDAIRPICPPLPKAVAGNHVRTSMQNPYTSLSNALRASQHRLDACEIEQALSKDAEKDDPEVAAALEASGSSFAASASAPSVPRSGGAGSTLASDERDTRHASISTAGATQDPRTARSSLAHSRASPLHDPLPVGRASPQRPGLGPKQHSSASASDLHGDAAFPDGEDLPRKPASRGSDRRGNDGSGSGRPPPAGGSRPMAIPGQSPAAPPMSGFGGVGGYSSSPDLGTHSVLASARAPPLRRSHSPTLPARGEKEGHGGAVVLDDVVTLSVLVTNLIYTMLLFDLLHANIRQYAASIASKHDATKLEGDAGRTPTPPLGANASRRKKPDGLDKPRRGSLSVITMLVAEGGAVCEQGEYSGVPHLVGDRIAPVRERLVKKWGQIVEAALDVHVQRVVVVDDFAPVGTSKVAGISSSAVDFVSMANRLAVLVTHGIESAWEALKSSRSAIQTSPITPDQSSDDYLCQHFSLHCEPLIARLEDDTKATLNKAFRKYVTLVTHDVASANWNSVGAPLSSRDLRLRHTSLFTSPANALLHVAVRANNVLFSHTRLTDIHLNVIAAYQVVPWRLTVDDAVSIGTPTSSRAGDVRCPARAATPTGPPGAPRDPLRSPTEHAKTWSGRGAGNSPLASPLGTVAMTAITTPTVGGGLFELSSMGVYDARLALLLKFLACKVLFFDEFPAVRGMYLDASMKMSALLDRLEPPLTQTIEYLSATHRTPFLTFALSVLSEELATKLLRGKMPRAAGCGVYEQFDDLVHDLHALREFFMNRDPVTNAPRFIEQKAAEAHTACVLSSILLILGRKQTGVLLHQGATAPSGAPVNVAFDVGQLKGMLQQIGDRFPLATELILKALDAHRDDELQAAWEEQRSNPASGGFDSLSDRRSERSDAAGRRRTVKKARAKGQEEKKPASSRTCTVQ
eukprot:TRINITY_DN16300_c0_g1_i1.p1 TRINITY_DN16300_c0_g1~~TRINITY_DN16300_c0_g1_i1.p1  ORF type:complete len:2000 (+),score=672.74 TRINITY_DN16300_c0_g1_i1:139-6000(+)